MKIKIALVIPTLDQGGAEKQISLLARELPKDEFDVHVIVLTRTGPREKELREAAIPVHFIDKRGKFDPRAWLRLRSLLKQLKPDIVHTWLFAANAYGRSAAMAAGVPVIAGSERSVDPWKANWQLFIDRWLCKWAPRLTTNSSGVVDFYANKGIPQSAFTLIPNAVLPSAKPAVSRVEIAERLGVPVEKKWILSVGRLWQQKGYKDLLWAAEMIRVARDETCYIVVGEGPERARLELYRDNIRAASQVFMVGERNDVSDILPHACVLWNGSLYEGQSNVILEALQAGVPVVASDIPGNRDLVKHAQTGMLFPLGDVNSLMRTTIEILQNPQTAQQLATNGKAFVEHEHSLGKMIDGHIKLYRTWIDETR